MPNPQQEKRPVTAEDSGQAALTELHRRRRPLRLLGGVEHDEAADQEKHVDAGESQRFAGREEKTLFRAGVQHVEAGVVDHDQRGRDEPQELDIDQHAVETVAGRGMPIGAPDPA